MIGDASAGHLESRWKFSDLLAAYEFSGATAFLWSGTYLQFWNRDKRKRPDGVISADSLFAARRNRSHRMVTRDGLEAEGAETVGGFLPGNTDPPPDG